MGKGQMSLEMIIGLLILLVVAVVVIRMFLNTVDTDKVKPPENTLKYMEFESGCENLCTNFLNYGTKASLSNYCSERLRGVDDLNGNAVIDSFDASTLSLKICEDTIYCFQIVPCKTDTGIITWDQCRQSMCNAKYEVYQDWNKADEKVLELIPGPGSCILPDNENWWNMYFGSKPCTNPGKGPIGEEFSLILGACIIDSSDWSFSCDISSMAGTCENDMIIMGTSENALWASHGTNNVGEINFGSSELTGILSLYGDNPPTSAGTCSYNFMFACDINNDNDLTSDDFQTTASSCQIV